MPFPFDYDIPILLCVLWRTLFRGVSTLRASENDRAIPIRREAHEVAPSELTAEQAKYLDGWDKKLALINYHPVCTFRTVMFAENLQRAYIGPNEKALCTVMVVELKTKTRQEAVVHSSTVRFVTNYGEGRTLVTRNMKRKTLMDTPPGRIVQECPNVNNVAELKKRHDRQAAELGEALWPPADAKSILELDERGSRIFNQYQVERGILKLNASGDAYVMTDKAHRRGIRNHYNPFAQRFSLARVLPAIVIGAAVPLLSLLKLAPTAAALAPGLPAAEAANIAAYLTAGALIGFVLDRSSFFWTFVITYVAAHAVLGWSFGPLPYSTLAALASFHSRQFANRRRLILLKA